MKRRAFLRNTAVAALAVELLPDALPSPLCADEAEPRFSWKHTPSSVALTKGDRILWQHMHSRQEGKPYFSAATLANGTPLIWLRPPDHLWHRGLWFSWKYINGLNYWDPDTGSEGLSDVAEVKLEFPDTDRTCRLQLKIKYHPKDQPAVLTEERSLVVSSIRADGGFEIDWKSAFTAVEQVKFDRTPIPGQKDGVNFGGYAGLSARMARELGNWEVINSENQKNLEGHGKNARWMDFTGSTTDEKTAGIAIFDHPSNPRHPTPWYLAMDKKVPFGYFGSALLFKEPLTLKAGSRLELKYRLNLHAGRPDAGQLEEQWKRFAA
jgi:hypothetical protein